MQKKLMEANEFISKVDNSEWRTPLVPVLKPNNEVRLCADYKVTEYIFRRCNSSDSKGKRNF